MDFNGMIRVFTRIRVIMTTIGKIRHLSQCSTEQGHFTILAIDHRDNLLGSLNKYASAPLTDAEFRDFKKLVMGYLLPLGSAVLVDPVYGYGSGIVEGVISGRVGLLAPLEVTNYDIHPSQRETAYIENWSIAKLKRSGGSGVKLLLYYHPEADAAPRKQELVARIVDECTRWDIPFFLEPIAYSLDPSKSLDNVELRQVVVESARVFSHMGIDVLKTEFPLDVKLEPDEAVWRAALADLNTACNVPWALLSAGVDYATFKRQAELACQAGASGVIVGRAVWSEAVTLQGQAREEFLKTTGRQRMKELADICAASAVNWRQKLVPPDMPFDWFQDYPE
jgi:tagatose 1,6-diphosphate aldolase